MCQKFQRGLRWRRGRSRFHIPQLHGDAGYDPLNRFADELKKLNRPWEAVGEQPDLLARREVSRQFITERLVRSVHRVDHETSCHDLRVRRRTRRHRNFTQLRA